MKKTRLFKVLSAIVILVVAVVTLTVTMLNTEENHLISVQQEALKHLEEEKGNYAENKIVLQNTNKARAQELALSIGAELRTSKNGEFATLTLPEGVSIEDVYKNDNNRKYIEEMSLDYKVYLAEEEIEEEEEEILHGPNYQVEDTYYNMQTYLNYLNMQDVWNVTQGEYSDGQKVKVAVIDTGIDTDHPEFFDAEGNSIISTKSYDATNDKVVDMYDMSVIEDTDGHGTAVAGVIAAQFNGEGIVGVTPNVELLVIKCEYDDYTGAFKHSSDLIYGIYYAIEQDVNVINMSFGSQSNITASAIQLAVDSDIICVAAAGNDHTDTPNYPAADPNTIGVGALAQDSWELADYSNYGDNSDIVAPGTTFTSTIDGSYGYKKGTSLAAPIVTAVVALYVSQNKYVTFNQVKAEITAAGKDLGDLGNDYNYGYGCIDVNAFIFEEKGTITWDYCTEELENTEQTFVRQHTIQSVPDPERDKLIFDDWYYDKAYTRPFNYDEYFTTEFVEDITLYAKWANEDDEDSTAFVYTVLEDGTAEIVSYKGKRRHVTIPDEVDGYVVSSIGKSAFSGNSRLKSVIMPKGLKYIKLYAFSNCFSLREVEFTGDELKAIGIYAFYSCGNLKEIEILDGVIEIGEKAFAGCSSLSKIHITENSMLETIGNYAFSNTKISSFYISQYANFNGSIVFECKNVRSVTIHPKNIEYVIEDNTVYNSDKTTLLYYPSALAVDYVMLDSIQKIDDYAFCCSKIYSIKLNDNVLSMGNYAFSNTMNLDFFEMPNSVKQIGKNCFEESSIRTISLSNGLDEISPFCFKNSNLEEVEIPSNVTNIQHAAFQDCNRLRNVIFSENSKLKQIRGNLFDGGAFEACSSLKTINLPSGLVKIEYRAFSQSGLEVLNIPSSVEYIDDSAFESCSNLTSVIFEETALVTTIPSQCFKNCTALTSVVFSDKITDIETEAFFNCYSLITLEFTENSKLTNIGPYAFYNTVSLKSMQLPSSVVSIDDFAYTFSGLRSVVIPSNLTNLGKGVFGGCYSLIEMIVEDGNTSYTAVDNCLFNFDVTKVYCVPSSRVGSYTLPETVKVVGQYSFYYDIFLTNVILSSGLEDIQENAFYNCWLLQGIDIPASVFNIGRQAFCECRSLKYVNFAEDSVLERLGYGTFIYCTSLESVRIPSSITSMAQCVFLGCYNLRSITFAENSKLEYIAAYMFNGCDNLEEIIFEKGSSLNSLQAHALDGLYKLKTLDFGDAAITNIDNYALYNLSSLEEFIIPSTVEYIGRYAFYNNQKIERLDIPVTVEYIGEAAFNTRTNNIRIFFVSETLPEYVQTGWDNGIAGYYLNAKDYVVTDSWEYVVTYSDTIETASYKGRESTLNVDTIDGLTVAKIGAKTFYNNDNLTIVTLSDDIVEIDNHAFYDCDNLIELIIPSGVTRIGKYAFAESEINVNLSFINSLKIIDDYAFSYNAIEVVDLPDSVESIGDYAFSHSCLTTLKIGETSKLKSIGNNAFVGTELQAIYLPSTLINIGDNAFNGVITLTNVEFAGGENKLKLGHSAFNNTGISEVTIPANVYYIGEYTFGSNQNLINIYVDSANTSYSSIDGMLCNITGNTLIQYPTGREGDIVIPSCIEIITYAAFKDAKKINEVTFEDGSTVRTIGWEVFAGCSALTKITVPDSVISFDYYSFKNCTSLTDVILSENSNLVGVYDGAFYNCTSLKNIMLPTGVVDISNYAFYNCKSLEKIPTKENSMLRGIGAYAFYGTEGITGIPYYSNLEEIGAYAFTGTNVVEYTLPASVVDISSYAFYDAKQFENIYCEELNEIYESIGGVLIIKGGSLLVDNIVIYPYAHIYILGEGKEIVEFSDTDLIRKNIVNNIIFADSVKKIGSRAFLDCKNISQLPAMEQIIQIGELAFYNCHKLKTINISNNIESIGLDAFKNCFSIEEIYFNATIPDFVNKSNPLFGYAGIDAKQTKLIIGKDVEKIPDCLFRGTRIDVVEFEAGSVCEIIGYASFGGADITIINIPESVRFIEKEAFAGCKFTKLNLPKNITRIEAGAFEDCYYLSEVIFNCKKLEDIPKYAGVFQNIGMLIPKTTLKIGNDVERIPACLFDNEDVNLCLEFEEGAICESIGESAFYNCVNLTSSQWPLTIKHIEDSAFYNCIGLTDINISSAVTIGAYSFSRTGLNSITLSNTITNLGEYAFAFCNSLEKIYYYSNIVSDGTNTIFKNDSEERHGISLIVGNNVTQIPSGLFASSAVTKVEFESESNLIEIGNSAFADCTLLAEFNIPKSVKKIGSYAFSNCSFKEIELHYNIEEIGDYIFNNIKCLERMYYNVPYVDSVLLWFVEDDRCPISIIIGKNVKKIPNYIFRFLSISSICFEEGSVCESIGASAFYKCSNLSKVELPSSVIKIEDSAFRECSDLVEISFPEVVEVGNLILWNSPIEFATITTIVANQINTKELKEVIITKGEIIEEETFADCNKLVNVVLSEGITTIGNSAFYNCSSLEEINIPKGVTSIGTRAFYNCEQLRKIEIPESMISVGNEAFRNCSSIQEIRYNAVQLSDLLYGNYVFSNLGGNTQGTKIIIGKNVKRIPNYLFFPSYSNFVNLTELEFEEGSICETIGNSAFYDCSNLTSVILPESITSIENSAFYNCSGLTTFDISTNVNSIGSSAFSGCSSLMEVILPESLTKLGLHVFKDCKSINRIILNSIALEDLHLNNKVFSGMTEIEIKVYVSKNITRIPAYLFFPNEYESLNIVEVEFEEGSICTSIGAFAFANCDNLFSINLPSCITNLESNSFSNCSSLSIKELPNSLLELGVGVFENCTSLTSLTIPENVENINRNLFKDCINLDTIILHENIKSIGENAFAGCALTSISFYEGLESIGENAFAFCNITEIFLPESISYVGENAFVECPIKVAMIPAFAAKNINNVCLYEVTITSGDIIGELAFENCINLVNVTLPETLQKIGYYAFRNCSNLTNIVIPKNLISIENGAFANCAQLSQITINSTSLENLSLNNGIFSGSGENGIKVIFGKEVQRVPSYLFSPNTEEKLNIIDLEFEEESVCVEIGEYAFYNCYRLTNLELPACINNIGYLAFIGCPIETATIPAIAASHINNSNLREVKVTIGETIEANAFAECENLISVELPNTITTIGLKAFYNCSSLINVNIPENLISIGESAFESCNSLSNVVFGDKLTTIESKAFAWCNINNLTLPNSISILGSDVFIDCPIETATIPAIAASQIKNSNLKEVVIISGDEIVNNAFYNCSSLMSVLLPETIISIGENAFRGCSSLANIDLPEGLLNIGKYAFAQCKQLENIVIPNNILSIENSTFYECAELKMVDLPENLKVIGTYAFYGCGLTDIYVSDSLESIGENAFANCPIETATLPAMAASQIKNSNLKEVVITSGNEIGASAFYNCSSLTKVEMPESIEEIGNNAFYGCTQLIDINIPKDVLIIGENAFYSCVNLTVIELEKIIDINSSAFAKCSSLTSVYISDTLSNIGINVFSGCPIETAAIPAKMASQIKNSNLKEVTIISGTIINSQAFANCTNLTSVILPNTVTNIEASAFYNCSNLNNIDFTNITNIGNNAFYNCNKISEIIINKDTLIGNNAFENCSNVQYIYFNSNVISDLTSNSSVFSLVGSNTDGVKVVIGKDVERIPAYLFYSYSTSSIVNIKEIEFEEDGICESIGKFAFSGCINIKEIVLPTNITSVETDAFGKCQIEKAIIPAMAASQIKNSNLKEVVITSGDTIGSSAFSDCTNLTSVTLPESITSIDSYAFSNCSSLTTLDIPAKVNYIGSYAFSGCSVLSDIQLPEGLNSINSYTFKGCTSIKNISIPSGVTSIGENAFENSGITSIELSESITSIGKSAFANCLELESITYNASKINQISYNNNIFANVGKNTDGIKVVIGNDVLAIPAYLFAPNSFDIPKITSVEFENGSICKEIGNNTFYNCNSLVSLILPSTIEVIGENAFNGCNNLSNLELPESIISIGGYAFSGCNLLEDLILGEKVTNIGMFAFSGCNLKNIHIFSKNITISDSAFNGCSIETAIIPANVAPYIKNSSLREVEIISGTEVETQSFYNCSNLISVLLPEGITSIKENAFYGCSKLSNIELPETLTTIESSAFNRCSSLTALEIPTNVNYIGSSAFSGCSSLSNIIVSNNVSYVGSSAFYNCPIETATIPTIIASYIKNVNLREVIITSGDVIEQSAFSNCNNLVKVILPESITSIGESAFYNCSSLTNIIIPSKITQISKSAFSGCSSLISIKLSEGILSIENKAFYNCSSLTTIEIPKNVTKIGASAFANCINVEEIIFNAINLSDLTDSNECFTRVGENVDGVNVVIGKEVTKIPANLFASSNSIDMLPNIICIEFEEGSVCETIGTRAFYNCSGLTRITIPENITTIGTYAFYNCSNVEEIYFNAKNMNDLSNYNYVFERIGVSGSGINIKIGKDVTKIPAYAFYPGYNSNLNVIGLEFEDGSVCETIGASAFEGCLGLTKLELPESVSTVGSGAFRGCPIEYAVIIASVAPQISNSNLKEVIIISGETIEASAFNYCSSLTSITLPDTIISIGESAFNGCSSLTNIILPESLTRIESNTFNGCSSLMNVDIPEGVVFIGNNAFNGCNSLTSITIPENVETIGNFAFSGCQNIEEINYNAVNLNDLTNSNYVFSYVGKNGKGVDVIIGKGVTKIPAYLFYPYNSDNNTPNIVSVEFEEGSICESIGSYAFSGCKNLEKITIPKTVTNVGRLAFNKCPIKQAIIPAIAASYIKNSSLEEVVITNGETIEASAFSNCYNLTKVSLPETIVNIEYGAFYNCSSLTSIVIPEKVETIEESAFYNCSSLTSITIPTNVTSIGDSAFAYCKGLEEIKINSKLLNDFNPSNYVFAYVGQENKEVTLIIGKEVTKIPANLFNAYYNTQKANIISVEFEDGSICESIGENAFIDCKSLLSINLPDTIKIIENYAFADCIGLKEVVWSNNLNSTGDYAFRNCRNLIDISLGQNLEYIGKSSFSGCQKLEYIELPNSLKELGENAFANCNLLKLEINSIDKIGYGIISGCTNIQSIIIPFIGNSLLDMSTSIIGYVFGSDNSSLPSSLKSVTITSGIELAEKAFYKCTNIENIILPDSLEIIGNNAFEMCSSLVSISIPNKVKTIPFSCFCDCVSLQDVKLPLELTNIAAMAFDNCTSLEQLIIPQNVTQIDNFAFIECSNLKSVYIDSESIASTLASTSSNGYLMQNLLSIAINNNITNVNEYVENTFVNITEINDLGQTYTVYSKHQHTWEEKEVLVDRIECVQDGIIKYECFDCLLEDERIINKHTEVIDESVSASCTQSGLTEGKHCLMCNEVLLEQTIIPALGHNYESIVTNPTCESKGYTTHTCLTCQYNYIDGYKDSLGHSLTQYSYLAPTCENVGHEAYEKCNRCDYTTYVEISSLGHKPMNSIKENEVLPTCIFEGSYDVVVYCNVCEKELSRDITIIPATGHDYEIGAIISSTCEEKGYTTYVCHCGDSYNDAYVDELGHDYGVVEYAWNYDYTRLTATHICNRDNSHIEMESVSVDYIVLIAPTCEKEGLGRYVSNAFVNGYFSSQTREVVLPALGHELTYFDYLAPTCEEIGHESYEKCNRCDYTTYVEISALGHNEVIDEAVSASCTQSGLTEGKHCLICNEVLLEQSIIPATGHSYESTIIAATCELDGYTLYQCHCGDSYTDEYVLALGHNYGSVEYVWNNDYTSLTATHTCLNDNSHIEIETVSTTYTVITEPTCLNEGLGRYVSNNFTNASFVVQSKEVTLAALGHDLTQYDYKAPTCEEIGHEAYENCNRCDYTTYQEIAALGHNYESTVTKPTCLEQGYTTHTCSVCSDTYVDSYIEVLGHNYGSVEYVWNNDYTSLTATHTCLNDNTHIETETVSTTYIVITEPTCLNEGLGRYVSNSFTNASFVVQSKDITLAALGHDTEQYEYKAPTCEEIGHEAYEKCLRCDYTTYKEIAALGHIYNSASYVYNDDYTKLTATRVCSLDSTHIESETVDVLVNVITLPTCEADGLNEHVPGKFSIAGFTSSTLYRPVPALGHSYNEINRVNPTCETDGFVEYVCDNDKTHTYKEELKALGHTYESVITKPTCLEQGYTTHTCNVCGDIYKDTYVDALGHDTIKYEYKAPTCEEKGHEAYEECSRCDYTTYQEIAALGHNFEAVVTKPTCLDEGYTTHTCSRCDDSYKDTYVEALDHDLSHYEYKAPTCEENGHEAYEECSRCDYTTYQEIDALGHKYHQVIKNPTCEAEGYTTFTCIICYDYYIDNYTNALGHDYIIAEKVDATCETNGYIVYVCNHNESHTYKEELKALGHAYELVVTNPTCLERGYTTHTCSVCGDSYEDTYVAALGHDLTHYEYKAPGCEKDGHEAYDACNRCDYSTYEKIPAKGHNYEHVKTAEPTCTSSGYMTFVCTNDPTHVYDKELNPTGHTYGEYQYDNTHHWKECHCGDIIKDQHKFSNWEIVKEPTTSENGLTERSCECGYKESEIIPKIKKGCFGGFEQSMIAVISLSCITLYISKKRKKETE